MGRTMAKKRNQRPKRLHKKGPKEEGSLLDDQNVAQKSEDVKFIDKLLEKAQSLIDCFEYEAAQQFCQRALDLEPNNVHALETSAGLMLDVGEVEAALQCLERAVSLSPDDGFNKYLTLGQVYEGVKAVESYQKGIEVMETLISKNENGASGLENNDLKKSLSCAYCSVAEIYMSDCCFEESAEIECKKHIDKAIEIDETNPETYLCLANLLMVQDKKDDAKETLNKSLSLWLPRYQDIRDGKLDISEFDIVEPCSLSYDSRINTSKLLIELEMYDESIDVLEGLIEENDEVVEVWHLIGWTNFLHGDDYKGNARFYFNKAQEIAKKVNFDDEDLMKHIQDLLDELGPEVEEENQVENDEDEENWENMSDEENDEMES